MSKPVGPIRNTYTGFQFRRGSADPLTALIMLTRRICVSGGAGGNRSHVHTVYSNLVINSTNIYTRSWWRRKKIPPPLINKWMTNIHLHCPACDTAFEKPKKEHTRQLKRNADYVFYCSLRCAGRINVKSLPRDWNFSEAGVKHRIEAHAKAVLISTKYTEEQKPFAKYLRKCRNRTQKKKWVCDLTLEYLMELWMEQNGRCSLSGIPLLHSHETSNINRMASLDRKDSAKPYVQGNVQFIICTLNYAKNDRGDDSIRELISLLTDHRDNRTTP